MCLHIHIGILNESTNQALSLRVWDMFQALESGTCPRAGNVEPRNLPDGFCLKKV